MCIPNFQYIFVLQADFTSSLRVKHKVLPCNKLVAKLSLGDRAKKSHCHGTLSSSDD